MGITKAFIPPFTLETLDTICVIDMEIKND
jgi:hypothetical protein